MGLNIQYPYDIDWLPEESKPIGLFTIVGWLEMMDEKMKEEQERMQRRSKGFTEIHESDVSEDDVSGGGE